jgi:hypothetical protein
MAAPVEVAAAAADECDELPVDPELAAAVDAAVVDAALLVVVVWVAVAFSVPHVALPLQ